jgi:flagellar biosynthesis protein FliP
MDASQVFTYGQQGLYTLLIVSAPVLIALPFKLMLFVLADGWNLLLGSLAASFAT